MIIECEKCKAKFEADETGGAVVCPECGSAAAAGAGRGALFDEIRSEVMGEIDPDSIELKPGGGKTPEAGAGAGA